MKPSYSIPQRKEKVIEQIMLDDRITINQRRELASQLLLLEKDDCFILNQVSKINKVTILG